MGYQRRVHGDQSQQTIKSATTNKSKQHNKMSAFENSWEALDKARNPENYETVKTAEKRSASSKVVQKIRRPQNSPRRRRKILQKLQNRCKIEMIKMIINYKTEFQDTIFSDKKQIT